MTKQSSGLSPMPSGQLHWNLDSSIQYDGWRKMKLDQSYRFLDAEPVLIKDLSNPSPDEVLALSERCAATNMVLYETAPRNDSSDKVSEALVRFSHRMGLRIAEIHRSAGKNGVVALTVCDAPGQRGYLPYSQHPMNWHTDGYYNGPDQQIRAMVLHCFNPAESGGQNQFLDAEIAYIRLRDKNPDFVRALMHPGAMTIPENNEEAGETRPASVGPVFSLDQATSNLVMRYTARTRSIKWRKDSTTQQAVEFLQNLLESGDPLTKTATLKAGQGILCNNSLHNRTGFDPQLERSSKRLMFRIRFHNRIMES